jgi:hypothetical protein
MAENKHTTQASEKVLVAKISAVQAIAVALITAIATAIPVYFAARKDWQQARENPDVKPGGSESLRRTVDFLMGKNGTLNEKIDDYEKRLNIPQKGRFILFEHVNYKGHRCYLKPGDDVAELSLYGFANNVSSIKVEGALKGRAYSEVNYAGSPFLLIESDMPSLADYHWNDKIQSISVEK